MCSFSRTAHLSQPYAVQGKAPAAAPPPSPAPSGKHQLPLSKTGRGAGAAAGAGKGAGRKGGAAGSHMDFDTIEGFPDTQALHGAALGGGSSQKSQRSQRSLLPEDSFMGFDKLLDQRVQPSPQVVSKRKGATGGAGAASEALDRPLKRANVSGSREEDRQKPLGKVNLQTLQPLPIGHTVCRSARPVVAFCVLNVPSAHTRVAIQAALRMSDMLTCCFCPSLRLA